MGNTNSMVSLMFEEIKGLLVSIQKKIDEGAAVNESPSPPETTTEPKPEIKTDTIKPEQLIRLIQAHLQGMEQKTGQVSETVRESEKRVLSQLEELKRIAVSQKPDSKVHHYHVFEWKSSKVVIAIVSLSILFLASFIGNIHQFEINTRMTDNDLKYRYIKSINGINPENLKNLEDIFHYHRDKKKIRVIRGKVEEYERKIRETAEKLEREQ
ncbi:MAG: hypothetical protein Q8N05_20660 [Bacteroidota bacterium]|nr:hypothetical protein [Bacteroidota bacterium]